MAARPAAGAWAGARLAAGLGDVGAIVKLLCSGCGRQVGAGRYYRTGDTCGQLVITRPASIEKVGKRLIWRAGSAHHCTGLLQPVGKAEGK
jgi:hypothetical protein